MITNVSLSRTYAFPYIFAFILSDRCLIDYCKCQSINICTRHPSEMPSSCRVASAQMIIFIPYESLATCTYINQVVILWYVLCHINLLLDLFKPVFVHFDLNKSCLSSEFLSTSIRRSMPSRMVLAIYYCRCLFVMMKGFNYMCKFKI